MNTLEQFGIRQFSPLLAQDLAGAIATVALAGTIAAEKLPPAIGAQYDAQTVATYLADLSAPIVAALCDHWGCSVDTKAKLMAELLANPPVIPAKRAEAV